MIIKGIQDENFQDYKICSMFIAFPKCSFKCEKELRISCCQNKELASSPDVEVSYDEIVEQYINNPLSKAIIFGGLEPFESLSDVLELINHFRKVTIDPIIIYSGFTKEELKTPIKLLKLYKNIIIKYGRFIPDNISHYDEVLGINLISSNQYAEVIS